MKQKAIKEALRDGWLDSSCVERSAQNSHSTAHNLRKWIKQKDILKKRGRENYWFERYIGIWSRHSFSNINPHLTKMPFLAKTLTLEFTTHLYFSFPDEGGHDFM